MAFALVQDGVATELPAGADVTTGDFRHSYATVSLWSEEDRNALGIFTIIEGEPVPADCVIVSNTLEVDGDTVQRVIVCEPLPLATLKNRALAALADARWQACQTFTYDGVVAPADTALMAVTGYVVAAQILPPGGAQTWKLAPGHFRQWEASDVVAYGIAIRTHIQAAFDLEGERAALIEAAADHEELAAVPITTGWPA